MASISGLNFEKPSFWNDLDQFGLVDLITRFGNWKWFWAAWAFREHRYYSFSLKMDEKRVSESFLTRVTGVRFVRSELTLRWIHFYDVCT